MYDDDDDDDDEMKVTEATATTLASVVECRCELCVSFSEASRMSYDQIVATINYHPSLVHMLSQVNRL